MFKPDTRILVVDDMMTMRKIIIKNLKELSLLDVKEADDGAPAWELLKNAHKEGKPFQLVLCDWNMPKVKGIQLLKMVREDQRFGMGLPFVLITAESEKSKVIEALTLKVSNYVVKPFTGQQLKDKLEAVYKHHFSTAAAV